MKQDFNIPPIRMAEVFIDDNCVGFLSNVKLNQQQDGGFELEGEWSGYPDVLNKDVMFTISIPRFECRFLADKVETDKTKSSGKVLFKGASFLPDGPTNWLKLTEEGNPEE